VIHKAQPDYFHNPPSNLGITVDGYVFPKPPVTVFMDGQQHRVPMLIGNTSREVIPGTNAPPDFKQAIAESYGPLSERAQSLYAGPPDPIYGTPVDQFRTDHSLRCPSIAQSIWHAAAGNVAFDYEFAHTPVGREALGATHASDVTYVFGTNAEGIWGVGPPVRATAVDGPVSEVMQQYWTNFAKNGDPNGANLPNWPKFDISTRAYLQFTKAGPVAKEGLRRQFCDLFIENVKRLKAQR
jgi:para-nitrobenzyl esterase